MNRPIVVSRAEWIAARRQHWIKEKELARLRHDLNRQRRNLPWVRVEKHYEFDGPDGRQSLADLFDGRSQLIIYHFMFAPGWEEGCPGCSFLADHIDGAVAHLVRRDVSLVAASRAPLSRIEAFKRRMGWRFKWVSSFGNDFNSDFQVSLAQEGKPGVGADHHDATRGSPGEEVPGVSVFTRDAAGSVFHTYSAGARGLDLLVGAYNYLDLVPKGRDHAGLPWTLPAARPLDGHAD